MRGTRTDSYGGGESQDGLCHVTLARATQSPWWRHWLAVSHSTVQTPSQALRDTFYGDMVPKREPIQTRGLIFEMTL